MDFDYFDKRKSAISLIGDLPWGSRFCLFYRTEEDFLDILAPFFMAGLKNNEFCVWVISDTLDVGDVQKALNGVIPDFANYAENGQLEIIPYSCWQPRGGMFGTAVVSSLDKGVLNGFDGLRLACSEFPEKQGNKADACHGSDDISRNNVIAAFAYPRNNFDALGLMEVVKNYRFALVRNAGKWEVIESTEARVVKDELKRSEEKLQFLFSNMSEGFAYHRILLNADGEPCDYVFLEVNDAFERITGLERKNVVGKRATAVIPGLESDSTDWIKRYGSVALTGQPVQFDSYSEALDAWHSVSAFCPHRGYFAVTFDDITDRKRAEEALAEARRSLEQERDLLQTVMSGAKNSHLVYLDRAFNFVRVNDTYAQTCGYPPEEMIGLNHFALYPDPENEAIFARVRDTGEAVAYHDKPFEFPDQPERGVTYWDWTLTPAKEPDGKVVGLVFSLYETTVRKRAEEEIARLNQDLQQKLAELQTIFDTVPIGLAIAEDPQGLRIRGNRANERILGLPPGSELSKRVPGKLSYRAMKNGDELPVEQLPMQRACRGEIVEGETIDVLRADGQEVALYCSSSPLLNGNGVPRGAVGAFLDVTELKRAEAAILKAHDELEMRVRERTEELAGTVETLLGEIAERERAETLLRESEKKFRSLFEESKDMIYLVDADGRLVDVNPAGIDLFGYTNEEFFSLDIADELYCDPVHRELFLRTLHEDGFVRNFETRMRRKDGETLYVLKTASVTRGDGGEITGYRGIVHDISERKHLEQQLLQAQKMESIGLLAGGVAHDFNNLMTAVTGYGQLIRENIDPANELLTMCAEQLLGAAERATELTRNLLAFGRKQILNPKPVPVNEIIINVTKLLTRIIGEDIEFQTDLTCVPLTVMADRGQIDQVLVNLAANARDAMPDGGKLRIGTHWKQLDQSDARRCELEKPGVYALITVADTGIGMDERTRERIFEPFFTTKETGKGTGLGLSIIYGIVKQHNGAITVESEPDNGTTFTIYLPIVEDAEAETRKAAVLPAYGTETILLAEDDAVVRHFMKEMLKLAGFTVILAINGEEAVNLFRQHRDKIALVVSDVVMPRKNGKEVYDEIREVAPGMKFIFTSGYTDDIIHKKGLLDESLDFLMKPVGKNDLLQKVREVLDR